MSGGQGGFLPWAVQWAASEASGDGACAQCRVPCEEEGTGLRRRAPSRQVHVLGSRAVMVEGAQEPVLGHGEQGAGPLLKEMWGCPWDWLV